MLTSLHYRRSYREVPWGRKKRKTQRRISKREEGGVAIAHLSSEKKAKGEVATEREVSPWTSNWARFRLTTIKLKGRGFCRGESREKKKWCSGKGVTKTSI